MDIDKIDTQLDEIWKRVQAKGRAPLPPASTDAFLAAERDMLRQTLSQMKQQLASEKDRWAALLRRRDESLAAMAAEKKWLESEANRLREESRALRSELESGWQLQAVEKAEYDTEIRRQTDAHREEVASAERRLREVDELRRQEMERYEASLSRWKDEEKAWYSFLEQKSQTIAELNDRLNRLGLERQQERLALEEEKRRLDKAGREAIAAAEKERDEAKGVLGDREAEIQNFQRLLRLSQEEIVQFTRNQHKLETELKAADEQLGRLENEIRGMREAWEVERAHWRELWERERASREKWYDDMREWEDHLRAEREEWLRQFTAEEKTREGAAGRLAGSLGKLEEISDRFTAAERERRPARRRFLAAGAAAALAAGLLFSAASRALFAPTEFRLPGTHLSGMAAHGGRLWFADWMTGQVLEASAARPGQIEFPGAPTPGAHPVSVRWAKDRLWTLDPWARVVREHAGAAPFGVLREWPVNVAAPADFAWDGQGFWVLDGTAQTLRRFSAGDFQVHDREAALPAGWKLTALDFAGGEFWAYDASSSALRRFALTHAFETRSLTRLGAHARPSAPLTGLSAAGGRLWTLSEKSLSGYRWSRLSLLAARLTGRAAD